MRPVDKMIEYEDFSLKIEPRRGEAHPVIVLRSPAGEGRSSFRWPFDPGETGELLFDLGQTVRGCGRAAWRDASPAATRTGPQRMGDMLFDALFSGPVRSLFDRSLGMIHGHQRGLRIKLHIDPEDPSLAQLASLPWEFLYRKETRDFLSLSRFTPVLRYLEVQRPYTPLSLEPPLRILVVISAPIDHPPLDLERERALIEGSWARQEGVEVEFMEEATILGLQDRLGEQPYHVLHYMGHGGFEEQTGQGVLLMEDEEARGAAVDGSTLGVLLGDLPALRLVLLNACESARVAKEKGLDPFAGVASAMVMAGIPAVVAMQFPISDSAAITFAQRFYPLLARGYAVDAAVAEGRRAICVAEPGTMEWGTPVLFMRAPQGIIFEASQAQPVSDVAAQYDEAVRLLQAERYQEALERWQQVQALNSDFPDRQQVEAVARERLAAPRRKRQPLKETLRGKGKLPRWALAIIGALALSLAAGGLWAGYNRLTRKGATGVTPQAPLTASPAPKGTQRGPTATAAPVGVTPQEATSGAVAPLLTISREDEKIHAVAFSPDGTRLASGGEAGIFRVRDAASGEALLSLEGHADTVTSVTWSPDGQRLASGSEDRTVRIWDVTSGAQALPPLQGHTGFVSAVAWSPGERGLASVGQDEQVIVWDAERGIIVWNLKIGVDLYAVAWSPDGARLAVCGTEQVLVLDASLGTRTRQLTGEFRGGLAWSPDGQYLAALGHDNYIHLWQVEDWTHGQSAQAHTETVTSMAWSPDNRRLASVGYDYALHVWDLAQGPELSLALVMKLPDSPFSIDWSRDGSRLAMGGYDGKIRIWDATALGARGTD